MWSDLIFRVKTCTITCSFLVVFTFVNAQPADTLRTTNDTAWIESMENRMSIKFSINNIYEKFQLVTSSNEIKLSPNIKTNGRVNLNYKSIALAFQFSPNFLPGNGDEDTKGKTKSLELWTLLTHGKWFANVSYSSVRGYFLENTRDYLSSQPGNTFLTFPDLCFVAYALSFGYRVNPNFSIKNILTQTERQLKSAGSIVPGINVRYFIIDDKSTIQPGRATQKSSNLELGIGAGYIYTFVFKKSFYLSGGIRPGMSYINTKLMTRFSAGNIETEQNNLAFRSDELGAIGYNSSNFFIGLDIAVSGENYQQENTSVTNYDTRLFYEFFTGFRFK